MLCCQVALITSSNCYYCSSKSPWSFVEGQNRAHLRIMQLSGHLTNIVPDLVDLMFLHFFLIIIYFFLSWNAFSQCCTFKALNMHLNDIKGKVISQKLPA